MIHDITKDLIAYNASQSQDNQIRLNQSDLKTLYIDIQPRHNCVYDNPIRLIASHT